MRELAAAPCLFLLRRRHKTVAIRTMPFCDNCFVRNSLLTLLQFFFLGRDCLMMKTTSLPKNLITKFLSFGRCARRS